MTAAVKLQEKPPSALDALAQMLTDDMRGVNAMILQHLNSEVPLVGQVAHYLIAAGGKRLRPLLTVASARLCGDTSNHSHMLAAAVEFIHSASLLHDDVVDESHQRRGQPSANDAFGNQASVLVGDFLFARAFEFMVATGNLEILNVLANASTRITEGEVLQLTLAGDIAAREEDYLRVIASKTASLFAAATETGAVLGNTAYRTAMRDFGYNFGMAFQLVDDVLDYSADAATLNKNLGDDFREGKLTLPVILTIAAGDADERAFWQSALGADEFHTTMFERAQSLMQKYNVFTTARARANDYAARASTALQSLPAHPLRDALQNLLNYCVERTV